MGISLTYIKFTYFLQQTFGGYHPCFTGDRLREGYVI